ncbi:MAG TPA: prepilin-type N-terminal cleavage/methylation domain-containing protein [Myxococcales bacterium]|nr:prepilin-type N-terminal cleavage/methylation domain-containing protein [Myxococcales bacterium]
MRPLAPRQRGFTLLEVMISLAILAISLVAISGLNGGAVAMEAYSRRATEATLLLRAKMNDVEEQLQKDGFSDFDDEKHGTFDDEGSPGFAWRAEILKPDVQLDASQLLNLMGGGGAASDASKTGGTLTQGLAAAAAALGGPGNAGGTPGAAALAGGAFGGLLQTQATGFIETLKKSVRELRITVSWMDGKQERSVSASQEIVILPEMVGKTEQPQTQQPQTQTQTPGLQGLQGVIPQSPAMRRAAP